MTLVTMDWKGTDHCPQVKLICGSSYETQSTRLVLFCCKMSDLDLIEKVVWTHGTQLFAIRLVIIDCKNDLFVANKQNILYRSTHRTKISALRLVDSETRLCAADMKPKCQNFNWSQKTKKLRFVHDVLQVASASI